MGNLKSDAFGNLYSEQKEIVIGSIINAYGRISLASSLLLSMINGSHTNWGLKMMLILSAVFSLVFIVSTESLAGGLLAACLWIFASFMMF
jgi:hypothetical protein